MTTEEVKRSRLFNKQYLHGGFCAYCGEGCKPLVNNDKKMFGLCKFNGNHPDCGELGHDYYQCSCVEPIEYPDERAEPASG